MRQGTQIVLLRHPEKDGDRITPNGAMQAFAAALALGQRFQFDRLVSSTADRTWQAVQVARAALLGRNLDVTEDGRFMFKTVLEAVFGVGNNGRCIDEIKVVKAAGGTVGDALEISEYARRSRTAMTSSILELATEMADAGHNTALVLSHSPWLECAAEASTPYSVGEADAVLYIVDGGEIIATEHIPAPIAGKSN